MPTVSAISRIFNRRSANTRPWIFVTFILRGSRFRDTWAWLIKNRRATTSSFTLNQFLTVAIEGEVSPYTASKRSLISLRDFPPKNKNRITNRYCSFSIFLKSADTSDSTRSQNKTTSPIRLKFRQ